MSWRPPASASTSLPPLALTGDASKGGEVLPRLNTWGHRLGDTYRALNKGAHAAHDGDLRVLIAGARDLIAKIRQVTGGGAHVALDALGIAQTCVNALMSLRKKGRHVQVGIPSERTIALPIAYVIFSELEIIGSLGMQAHAYPPMLDLVRLGALPLNELVTKRVTLEQSPEALTSMDQFAGVGVTVITQF